jgi:GH24 family phage-related lysozyme (muramidase)
LAQVQYNPNATVQPEERAPDDYQREQANPAEFGGLIAQGEEKLGAGMTAAGKEWGEIQTADVSNNYQKEASQLAEHIRTLKGQDALNAQQGFNESLDKLYDKYKGQLSTGAQQLQFDNQNRPYTERYIRGQANTHFIDQGNFVAQQTASSQLEIATSMAATAGGDGNEATLGVARAKALAAEDSRLRWAGLRDNPDQINAAVDRVNQSVYKTYAEALAAKDPLRAQQFLDRPNIKQALGASWAPVYDQIRRRAEEQDGKALSGEAAHAAGQGYGSDQAPHVTDASQMLRQFEGFKSQPYWDVNHWRVGYGSDTVTRANGSIEPVTPFTTVSRADAERDLTRRVNQSSQQVQASIGADAWNKLSPQAQSSLTSVAYNYGHVPEQLIGPAQSGDPNALAAAIQSLPSNPGRRSQEAANVLGRFTLRGPNAGQVQPASMTIGPPEAAPPTQPEEAPTIQPAAFTVPQAPPVAQPEETPEELLARQIQYIENSDRSEQAKAIAVKDAELRFRTAQVAAAQTAAAKRERKETELNDVNGFVLKGDYVGALNRVDKSQFLDNTEKLTISDAIEKRSGNPSPAQFGPKFNDMLKRILLPSNDPNRIGDIADIYKAEANGDITAKGTDKLIPTLANIRKSTSEYGEARMVSNAFDFAKRHLSYQDDSGFVKIKDAKGEDLYDTQFTNIFLGQLDTWKAEGKPSSQFPLFDQKKLGEFIETLRPKRQMDLERLNALGDTTGDTSKLPPPPPPSGVNPEGWNKLVAQPPGQLNNYVWANKVAQLAADPKTNVPLWNASKFGKAGIRGEDVLSQIGVNYEGPQKPEGVGAEVPPTMRTGPLPPVKSVYERESEEAAPTREQFRESVVGGVKSAVEGLQPKYPTLTAEESAALAKKQRGFAMTPEEADLLKRKGL